MVDSRWRSYLTPKAEVRQSPLDGRGVFARAPIAQGELVAIWGGSLLRFADLMALPDDLNVYPVQIWDDLFVGPSSLFEVEPSDFVNHSCEPSCGVRGSVALVARRDVRAGEELTYDYGTTDALGPDLVCRCGAPSCRRVVKTNDWRDAAFRTLHEGYLSAWIQELVRREQAGG